MSLHDDEGAWFVAPGRSLTAFGAVFLALLAVLGVYVLSEHLVVAAGGLLAPLPGPDLLRRRWVWVALGMVAVGLGFAAVDDGAVAARPSPGPLGVVGAAFGGVVLVYAGVFVTVEVGLGRSLATTAHVATIPHPSLAIVWWNAVVPGLLVGLAYGWCFYRGFQGALRSAIDPRSALVGVTVLAGLYHWLVDPLATSAASLTGLVLVLCLVVASGYLAADLRSLGTDADLATLLSPTRIVALAMAAFLGVGVLVDVLAGSTTPAELALSLAWILVFAIAATAYERTRSALGPILLVAVFQAGLLLAPALAAALA